MSEPITKERLKKYTFLKMEYNNQLERLARLENDTLIPAMQEGDGSQRSLLKSSRMEKAAVRKMDAEKKIMQKIDEITAEMDEIEEAVESLTDPMQKEVLRLRYFDGERCRNMKWPDVAIEIYGSCDDKYMMAIWRTHKRALQELEKQKGQE